MRDDGAMDESPSAGPRPGVSRRALAKAAANAAWVTPVIAVASAAPAYAASVPIALLSSMYASGGGNNRTNVNVQIEKPYGQPALGSLSVTVTLNRTNLGLGGAVVLNTDVVSTNPQFAVTGTPSLDGSGNLTVSFVSTVNPIMPATDYVQRLLSFNVGLSNPNFLFPRGTMSALVTPASGTVVGPLPSTF